MIPLTRPRLGSEESAAVARVLASGMLVQGAEVRAFELALAALTGRTEVVAVANGTLALELALRALAIGAGDDVLCPALTWPSPAHAIRAVGARPVFVDVDLRTWNAPAHAFAAARTPHTRCAIAIDQFGSPAEHVEIARALPGVALVVDGACSLGAELHGRSPLASGVIACTSFHPRKIVTTGEGGACFTDDAALAEALRTLRNHGQRTPGEFTCASGNGRLTELQAAIGGVQLERLPQIVARRRALRAQIVAGVPALRVQQAADGARENGQTFGVWLRDTGEDTRQVIAELAAHGVQAGRLSYALPTLPQFAAEARPMPVAEAIAARGLALPLYPDMTDDDVATLVRALRAVIVERGRA